MRSFTRGIRWPGLARLDNPPPLVVDRIRMTCSACPSQWEGTTVDGDWIYVRYRWGYLSLALWSDSRGADWTDIYGEERGDEYDGTMNYAELKAAVPAWVTLPAEAS